MSKRTSHNLHNRKHIKNSHLLETLAYLGDNNIATSIQLIQYNEKQFGMKTLPNTDDIRKDQNSDFINWFKITGISDAQLIFKICKSFGVQRFDVKDLLSGRHITKVIPYEKSTFILMSAPYINKEGELELIQIAFILTKNSVISFQERESPIFDDVIEAIKSSRVQIKEKGVDYLLYILLNCAHSLYGDTTLKIAVKINDVEDLLIDHDAQDIDVMKFIQSKKKDYSSLKRIISPMREEYPNLLHNTNHLIAQENMMFFNDFDDKLRIASEDLEALHEIIISLTDLYFNNNNMRMNHIIKKLTVVSTIFIPLTFMVGVLGMNFDIMPELRWKYGYVYAWAILFLIVVVAVLYLKKKKWF